MSEALRLKRGLVLQGGGAKGAFQFGVVSELNRAGIRFDVVTGTSVGALNGALVATNSWDIGERLWSDMAIERVFDWTGLKALLTLVALPGILYHGWIKGEASPLLPKPLLHVFACLFLMPLTLLYIAWVVPFSTDESESILFRVIVSGVIGLLLLSNYRSEVTNRSPIRQTFGFLAPLEIWCSFWVLKAFVTWNQEAFRAVLQTTAIIISAVSTTLLLIGLLFSLSQLSIFSNKPLRDLIEQVLESAFHIPLIVTAGEMRKFFDPDDYYYVGGMNGKGDMPTAADPVAQRAYCANYLRVDALARYDARDCLATTAALPLGVVPKSNVFGIEGTFVDGGVADNTPWFPLIDDYPCEEIVVVLCTPNRVNQGVPSVAEWKRRDRDIRKMRSDFYPPFAVGLQTRKVNRPPCVIPFRPPQQWPSRGESAFKILAPSSSLGGFLAATLNFSAEKSRKNYQEGVRVARLAIESGMFSSV